MDEPIVWYEGSGTSDRRWLIANEQNSIIAVTDSSGAALNINSYDEYGQPASSNAGRFQFTGQMWLPEANLYNFKARDYAASLGRFMQTDPILQYGGLNIYAYVENDPVNAADPLGLNDPNIPEIVPGGRRTHLPPCPAGEECITVTAPFRIIGDIGAIEVFGHLPEADSGGGGGEGPGGNLVQIDDKPKTCLAGPAVDAAAATAYMSAYNRMHIALATGTGIIVAQLLGLGPEDPAADTATAMIFRSGSVAYQAHAASGAAATAFLWSQGLGSYAGAVTSQGTVDAILARPPMPPKPSQEGVLQNC
jgi:RHS repeat-associated protein